MISGTDNRCKSFGTFLNTFYTTMQRRLLTSNDEREDSTNTIRIWNDIKYYVDYII